MQAKLIFVEVLTRDTEQSKKFYSTLFGVDGFARSITDQVRAYHMPISVDGIQLHITRQPTEHPPRIVPYFAVDNLRGAIDHLSGMGAKLIVEPFPVHIPERSFESFREKAARRLDQVDPEAKITDKLGDVALMLDPDGNPIGLMQLEPFAYYPYKWGKFRQPLSEEQFEDHITTLNVAREFLFEEKDKL